MKQIITSLFFILTLTSSTCYMACRCAYSAQTEIDRCISKLEKKYEGMKDFHSLFTQKTMQGSINMTREAEGEVYFKKGGKMLWYYKSPEKQEIILDGQNLWVYLPEEKQVMKNNFNIIPSNIVVDLFRGKIDIQQKFKVTFIQHITDKSSSLIEIGMIPIIYNPTLKKLSLWIDPETYLIVKSSLEDEFGNRTIIEFSKIEVDRGIDDSIFKFTPPKGVEIFEPPKM